MNKIKIIGVLMIKVIAFDLIGVLVEVKTSRIFSKKNNLTSSKKKIINDLYDIKDYSLLKDIRTKYPNQKIVIATNHVSYIREYLENSFVNEVDELFISEEIGRIKPNKDYYEYILNYYNIKAEELLFIDDSKINIDIANKMGIQTIKVDRETNIRKEIHRIIR